MFCRMSHHHEDHRIWNSQHLTANGTSRFVRPKVCHKANLLHTPGRHVGEGAFGMELAAQNPRSQLVLQHDV